MTTRKYNRRKTKHRKNSKKRSRHRHKKKIYRTYIGGEPSRLEKLASGLQNTLDETTETFKNNHRLKKLTAAATNITEALSDTLDVKISKKKRRN